MRRLLDAEKVFFRIEDGGQRYDASFDLAGIQPVVEAVAGACGFSLLELTRDDYTSGFSSKTLGQIEVVRQALEHVRDGGSITLTTGVLAREPIAAGAAAAMANGALEAFVNTAAAEAPRGIRINAVSPNVLENSPHYLPLFPGQRTVTDEEVGTAYVLSVEGIVSGRIIEL